MKEIEMSDDVKAGLLLKVQMRQETGIDSTAINFKVSAIGQVTKTIEQMTMYLRENGLVDCEYSGPLYELKTACEKALQAFREELTAFLVNRYREKYLPNTMLDIKEFLAAMEKKAGKRTFDAEVIEDRIHTLMKAGRELTIEHLLGKARNLLPFHSEEKIESIIDGRRLHLRVFLRELNLSRGRELWLEEPEDIDALDILSKTIIFGTDPVTAQSNIRSGIPTGYVQSARLLGKHVTNSKPIKSLRFFANHKLTAEYENPEQARKVIEALITKKVTSPEALPKSLLQEQGREEPLN